MSPKPRRLLGLEGHPQGNNPINGLIIPPKMKRNNRGFREVHCTVSTLHIRGRGTLQSSAAGSPPEAVSVSYRNACVAAEQLEDFISPITRLASSSTDLRPVLRLCLTLVEELFSCCSVSLDRGVLPLVQRGLGSVQVLVRKPRHPDTVV